MKIDKQKWSSWIIEGAMQVLESKDETEIAFHANVIKTGIEKLLSDIQE